MAAKRYVVIPELLDIYFNVIPHFHLIFNAELISEVISTFEVSLKNKSKIKVSLGVIRDTYISF